MEKKELCLEEKLLSYSKYYYWEMEAPDPVANQILNSGPIDSKNALPIQRLNDLFNPGYSYGEQGYCIMPDGSGYVANYVRMNGVTTDMIDWWFVWHFFTPPSVPEGNGNLRYKIWCPPCHWSTGLTREEDMEKSVDNSIHMSLRRQDTKAFIEESLVPGGENLMIYANAINVEALGVDPKIINTPGIGTIVGALTDTPCLNFHYYRPVPGGVELRSRYWVGYTIKDKKPVRIKESMPTEQGLKDMLLHNMLEYPHLGRFLPSLYNEEHMKPVDEY